MPATSITSAMLFLLGLVGGSLVTNRAMKGRAGRARAKLTRARVKEAKDRAREEIKLMKEERSKSEREHPTTL